jgi:hypothetical protein
MEPGFIRNAATRRILLGWRCRAQAQAQSQNGAGPRASCARSEPWRNKIQNRPSKIGRSIAWNTGGRDILAIRLDAVDRNMVDRNAVGMNVVD